jgi:hypothetical protein
MLALQHMGGVTRAEARAGPSEKLVNRVCSVVLCIRLPGGCL